MIIRLTDKLRRKLKAPQLTLHKNEQNNPFIDWTSHLFIFSKTNDRRVLGSINDMIFQAKVRMIEGNLSPYDVSFELNTAPFSMFDYDNPSKRLDKLFADSIRAKSQ